MNAMTAALRGLAPAALTALSLVAAPIVVPTAALADPYDVPSGEYVLDKTHATVLWRVKHMGLSEYVGRFENFDISLTLDGEQPENSQVSAVIDASSVSTPAQSGANFANEVATDARLLNAGEFGEISFVSTSIEQTGESTATITGDLTMLGTTHSVSFDAEITGFLPEHPFAKKPAIGFKAVGVVNRTDYGMAFLAPQIVAPEVTIEIVAEFAKAE